MMFMSLCNELTVCLYHPLLLGSEQSNLHGKRHKSMKDLKHEMAPPFRVLLFAPHNKKTKMCLNWSPWQEFETLPCLLLVDVVVLMSSSVETRPLIPCHPLSPPFFTASTADCIRHPRLTLLWQKYVTCYQGSAVIPEGTRQTVKQTAVLLSRRCFSPLQIALGILPLSLSLSLSTCSSTFFRKIKKKGWRRVRAAVVQAKSLLQEAKHLWWDGSSAVFKDDTGDVSWTWKKGFLRIKSIWKKKPCGLNHCSVSVLFQFFFVHMRNKFFYMSAGESLFPHY